MNNFIFIICAVCTATILGIIATIYAIIKKNPSVANSEEEKPVAHRKSKPKFSTVMSNPEDEREREVDRLLKRMKLTLAEQQYVYDFLVETGKEKWRYIKNYEGFYRISSYGMIESVRYDKWLDPTNNRNSFHVCLSIDGNHKGYLVHKLVAETFIPNPSGSITVRPKDGNYLNCDVRNLEWIPRSTKVKVALAA